MVVELRESSLEEMVESQRERLDDVRLQQEETEVHLAVDDICEGGEGLILFQIIDAHGGNVAHALHIADIRPIAGVCLEDGLQCEVHWPTIMESRFIGMSARNIVLDGRYAVFSAATSTGHFSLFLLLSGAIVKDLQRARLEDFI
jgi:hypothetical protein